MDVDAAARVVAELDKEHARRRAAGAAIQEREAQRAAAAQASAVPLMFVCIDDITACRMLATYRTAVLERDSSAGGSKPCWMIRGQASHRVDEMPT